MNIDDALRVLEAVVDLWPNEQAWSDRTGEAWIAQLTHHDIETVTAALIDLHGRRSRRPAWADVAEAIKAAHRAASAHQQTALPAAPPDLERQVNSARMIPRKKVYEHHGHDRGGPGSCWCAGHDHSTREAFGFSTTFVMVKDPRGDGLVKRDHNDPVPGWWFDCPKCGDAQLAQHYCSSWTPAGIAFMREAGLRATAVATPVEMDPRTAADF